jgi:hypothetical protein
MEGPRTGWKRSATNNTKRDEESAVELAYEREGAAELSYRLERFGKEELPSAYVKTTTDATVVRSAAA